MRRIRVLIIDDSVVIRRILGDVIASDPSLEVVGAAANGRIGLQMIGQVSPDIVTMDVEMPEMDGLTTVRELRKTHRRLPVIMFSTLTERGASTTLDALSAGASDYVTKPSNVGNVGEAIRRISTELVGKIKGICGMQTPAVAAVPPRPRPIVRPPSASDTLKPTGPSAVRLLAVGCSTGGPVALATFIGGLEANFPVPVIITQHMPPMFTRMLADRLSIGGKLKVKEGAAGDILQAGHGYVAPGDYHMRIERHEAGFRVALNQEPPENSCRPAVDVMFRSVAATHGAGVLGVVLTGMGQDGMLGARQIRDAGGEMLVQDEATSVVWGMPGAVARDGSADAVLPLDQIADAVNRRAFGRTGLFRKGA
ncbi:protein-glutamate methylesterase/protein-glutamine glutaminase [Humisphaera borealis]|uniref:Protein-glutamate methylesterase/protein-glutamine glutaminase n=1 Tax=Humisphaera borealis TaxID=2807512 RepID=A0A7M2WRG1_9BACT|nr:chemotaxis response regulator protein-glutamate methylesterase [Humisphaera borealis]QOV88117.1 chemotaxis response regulator protein-glutamate methylesterase [Humisphaera borealis]